LPSLTVENYVKAIFKTSQGEADGRATTGRLAAELHVSPGTVTSMLKTLAESGLATYTPYEGVRLTEAGRLLALRMLRRHRLIELFLSDALGLDWDQVHDDAERMEHVASDFLIERIDEHLGHPKYDPHGDPIPTEEVKKRGQAHFA
jgi:DtxR family Mn-dependent transcriptional regulator